MKLEVVHPTFLTALGDTQRVEVLRSTWVPADDPWLKPVNKFIADHGLIPAVSVTYDDAGWMFGQVDVTVYAPPLVGA